jgi:hypothetical protein
LVGLLILLAGCRAKDRIHESKLYDRISPGGRLDTAAQTPGKMAAVSGDTITAECAHETYANASKGLIVGEAGLHEDVFALRDRASLAANAYSLSEALLLEDLLRAEAKVPAHSAAQADCIDEFAENFGTLTDALLQADKAQREMDLSAFEDSTKQAADQLQKNQHENEQPPAPARR